MRQVGSLNHSRWECKYHVVFIPKYRKKAIFGQIRRDLGEVFKRLAQQREPDVKVRWHASIRPETFEGDRSRAAAV